MKNITNIRSKSAFVLLMIVLTIAVVNWIKHNRDIRIEAQLKSNFSNFKTAYHSSVETYELATQGTFDLAINNDEITQILYRTFYTNDYDKSIQRGLLYRKLSYVYDLLAAKNMRQLHFHSPNGDSFLRFHKPSKYGDNLFEARPSIFKANKEKKKIKGFEMGKVVSGYRYVYPLFFYTFFVGTVETSIPVKSLIDSMSKLDGSHQEFAYILRRDLVDKFIFEGQHTLYSSSKISKDYVIEDAVSALADSPKPLSSMAKEVNTLLSKDLKVQDALKKQKSYSTYVPYKESYVSVLMLPMDGIERGIEGYLLSYKKDNTPVSLHSQYVVFRNSVIIINIIITFLILLLYEKARVNKEQSDELEGLLDTLAEGVYEMDENSKITKINQTALDILGYKKEEALGEDSHELFHAHDANGNMPSKACPVYKALLDNKEFYATNETFRKKNGEIVPVAIKAKPQKKADSKVLVIAFEDITQRKKNIEALRDAKEKAESADRVKSQFIANMSHEIRTPLNAIMAFGDFLQDTKLDIEQKNILAKQKDSSKLLLQMLNDILDYSKIEVHQLKIENLEISLNKFIKNINDVFSILAQKKNLTFKMHYSDILPSIIKSDELRLTQILNNLLGNAFKFTNEGIVALNVKAEEINKQKAILHFEVADTGIGISKEAMETLFVPFTQEDTSTTRRFGGSGLGLTITKSLIDLMGGSIDAKSEKGKGSRFFVDIPVEVLSWEKVKIKEKKPKEKEEVPFYQNKRFLIVEDNYINQEVLKKLLDKTQAEIFTADNGKEALDVFQDVGSFSCIFMDMHMPLMNGFEATREIRKLDKKIPILAISAATSKEDKQKAFECGIDSYLAKPIAPDNLFRVLKSYCKQSKKIITKKKEGSTSEFSILIVDDAPTNVHTLSNMLKKDYAIKVATNGQRAIQIAKQNDIDLILLDIMMPDMDGYEVYDILKKDEKTADIAIIFVTAKDTQKDEAYGLSLGAVDYITKPYSEDVVKARISRQVMMKEKTDTLKNMSFEDGLTKIANRRSFDRHIKDAIKQVRRKEESITVMMIDIDFFKLYNDNYGHDKGDTILYEVAQCLSTTLNRPSDFVARYGGEEFVVVLQGNDFSGATRVAKKLLKAIGDLKLEHLYSKIEKHITISLGMAFCHKDGGVLKEKDLINKADKALYEAKALGRNTLVTTKVAKDEE